MKEFEILPCPFCGEDVTAKPMTLRHKKKHFDETHFTVQCTNCGCEPDYCVTTEQEAVNIWNERRIKPNDLQTYKHGFIDCRKQIMKILKNLKIEV